MSYFRRLKILLIQISIYKDLKGCKNKATVPFKKI